jgi:hypothetical protein
VQLTLVAPRLAGGRTQGIEPFLFVPFDSFLYSVDILEYCFMSVSTLLATKVFTGGGLERCARWFLTGERSACWYGDPHAAAAGLRAPPDTNSR